MKICAVVQGMCEDDVRAVMADSIRLHLRCECVDVTDLDQLAEHLGELVTELLKPMPPEIQDLCLRKQS